MAFIRCDNGHLYEESQHSSCPHCGVELSTEGTRPNMPFRAGSTEGPTVRTDPGGAAGGGFGASGEVERTVQRRNAGPGRTPVAEEEERTRAAWRFQGAEPGAVPFSPVAGWLVCLKGQDRGRDFRLQPEGNFVGRSPDNDVVIANDPQISRDKHAIIFYDPLENTFVLTRGERARGVVRINGKAVYQPQVLNARDVIQLGETELLFVPLCGDDFTWDVSCSEEGAAHA